MAADFPDTGRLAKELEFLFGRINLETRSMAYPRHYKLETMRALLNELGNPQDDYHIVHVAGTKGKGSVATMIAGGLIQASFSTGLYTSPHLESINERISVNGRQISDEALLQALCVVNQTVRKLDEQTWRTGGRRCSFFEIITAAAMLHFSNAGVNWVVLEVGLGGRLDSTNVCEPQLCVITNVSIDHTRQLGDTVDRIAREKAGIIKPGVPVISGATHPQAAAVIRSEAARHAAPCMELGRDFFVNSIQPINESIGQRFDTSGDLAGHQYEMRQIELAALGSHQAANAAIAVAALQHLSTRYSQISESSIRHSMETFDLKGRFEVISQQPKLIIDISHNVASIEAFAKTIQDLYSNIPIQRRGLIFASSNDKDVRGMLRELLPHFGQACFTRFVENPRSTAPSQLLEVANVMGDHDRMELPVLSVVADPASAWRWAKEQSGHLDLICITGSAFLVAEMRPLIVAEQQVHTC